ncbi:MAG: ABC transporter ATP-binding protein [Gemmatimonadota bacterium]|nr:ABC transporter ATP-binding protein [Gemmatimonadota bacterium]
MSRPLLEVHQLTKYYGATLGVTDVSFRIEEGQIMGLLGPNGAGKTTTLGMILGVVRPTRGWIEYNCPRLPGVRYSGTLEYPGFMPAATVESTLHAWARLKRVEADEADRLIRRMGLVPHVKKRFSGLSVGLKQRVAVACALIGSPPVLVLDEPGMGLDPAGIQDLRELLSELAHAGHGIIVSSHQLDEIDRICTDIVVVKDGVVVLAGSTEEIRRRGSGGLRVEVEDPVRATGLLDEIPEVTSIRREGDVLIVTGRIGTRDVVRHLARHDIYVDGIASMAASIEEIFVRATRDAQNGGIV